VFNQMSNPESPLSKVELARSVWTEIVKAADAA
jgi:hypothetical protein